MTLRRLIIALTFLSIFTMAARVSIDTDSWWHLQTGKFIAENREIPKADLFSHTRAGEPWTYPSAAWLSELRLFLLFDRFGPGAVNIWVAAIVTATFAFLYFTLSGGPFLRALVLILATATSSVFWAARPHITSFFFSAVFLWLLEDYRSGKTRRLYLLPLVMLVWVNSHPGFAIGFLLLAIYFVDRLAKVLRKSFGANKKFSREKFLLGARDRLGGLVISSFFVLLAASINPAGPAILAYPFETLSIGILREFIQEWQSPNFHNADMLPFLVMLVLNIMVLGLSKKRIRVSDLLLIAIFASMSLLAARNIAQFALVSAIVLARHARPLMDEWSERLGVYIDTSTFPSRNQSLLNWSLLIFMVAAAATRVSTIVPIAVNEESFARQVPVSAVEFVKREKPSGNLLNSYNWGGYLIWALPELPVFVDGRTDLYDDEILTEWLEVVSAEPGWQDLLDKWEIGLILLEPDWPVVAELEDEGWLLSYEDEQAVVYTR
jgi:hypothetical protein